MWSNNSTNIIPCLSEQDASFSVLFNWYFVFLVAGLGLVGNTLSILTFMCTKLRQVPSSHYLATLAIADLGVLLCNLLQRLQNKINMSASICCALLNFTYYTFSFLSVWCVVIFTIERFIVVFFPMKRFDICKVSRARLVILVASVFAAIFNAYQLFSVERVEITCDDVTGRPLSTQLCLPLPSMLPFLIKWNIVDTVFTMAVPLVIIISLNCLIAHRLVNHYPEVFRRQSRRPEPNGQVATCSAREKSRLHTVAAHSQGGQMHREHKQTKMLLIIALSFVVLNLPDHIVRICSHFQVDGVSTVQPITNALFQLSFAVNFLLYNLAGKNFRTALKELFGKLKKSNFVKI